MVAVRYDATKVDDTSSPTSFTSMCAEPLASEVGVVGVIQALVRGWIARKGCQQLRDVRYRLSLAKGRGNRAAFKALNEVFLVVTRGDYAKVLPPVQEALSRACVSAERRHGLDGVFAFLADPRAFSAA